MNLPHNIEQSAFNRGQYVGYGRGAVWIIKRIQHAGVWRATDRDGRLPAVERAKLVNLGRILEGEA